MFEKLRGRCLLVIGGDYNYIKIVNTAHQLGVYVICTDRNTDYFKSPAKQIADEALDIDYGDVEAVAQKCLIENIEGVFAGYSEFRVLSAAKIAKLMIHSSQCLQQ